MSPLFFSKPADFAKWLQKNHTKATELWVGFYKKATGKPSIDWPESVDEALCYGWIDGIRKSIDEESYMIRFTPRRKHSIWSSKNLASVKRLIETGRMKAAGLTIYEQRKLEKSDIYSFEQVEIKLSEVYEKNLKANAKAWAFFHKLPPSVKKLTIWWVMSAKQEATKKRRLKILIECSEEGLRIPMLRR